MNTTIYELIVKMREYQKKHNITRECITNTQYLLDNMKTNGMDNVKAQAVIVVGQRDGDIIVYGGHIVVVDDEENIYEASYELSSLDKKRYYNNFKDFMDFSKEIGSESLKKQTLTEFLKFTKNANRINSGEGLICNKQYYHKQANYVDKYFTSMRSKPPTKTYEKSRKGNAKL